MAIVSSTDGSPPGARWNRGLQRGVFLHVLAVFVEGGRPDAPQLPAREGGLQHVGGVHRPLRLPRPHEGMQFVDEEDHLPLGGGDLLQDRLQPVLELAPVFRAGDEGPEIEGEHPLLLQPLRDIPGHHPLGEPLHDRGLPHSGFADEDGVVLRASGEDLDHAADLAAPPDHRVELVAPGRVGQVAAILFEGLVLRFGVLVGDPLGPADGGQRGKDRLAGQPASPQEVGHRPGLGREGEEEVLGGDEFVLERVRFGEGTPEQRLEAGRQSPGHRPGHLRQRASRPLVPGKAPGGSPGAGGGSPCAAFLSAGMR